MSINAEKTKQQVHALAAHFRDSLLTGAPTFTMKNIEGVGTPSVIEGIHGQAVADFRFHFGEPGLATDTFVCTVHKVRK